MFPGIRLSATCAVFVMTAVAGLIVGCSTNSAAKAADRGDAKGAAPPSHQAAADQKVTTINLGEGVTMDLVFVPAGSFMMGSEKGHVNEKPVHKVTITKPFFLGKFEVTQEQWQAVMGTNPSRFKGPKRPVESVSWDDCQIFLKKLTEKMPGRKFGLPAEAQWEHACRAGTATELYYGDNPSGMIDYAWWADNTSETRPVGEKKPNAWGLYDMYGNVWEWCADWWAEYTASEAINPAGPASGSCRVLRGGAWSSPVEICHSASRIIYFAPGYRHRIAGFRVALEFP